MFPIRSWDKRRPVKRHSERKLRRTGAVGTKGNYCLFLITIMATEASSKAAPRYRNI